MANKNSLFPVMGAEVINAPLLSEQEERDLIQLAKAGDAYARESLITHNVRLVIKEAHAFLGRGLDLEDLTQEGTLGLAHAIDKFDPSQGTRLSTYAIPWIRQHMGVAIAKNGRTIRLPASQIAKVGAINKARNEFIQEFHIEPTAEELSEALDFKYTPEDIGATLHSAASTISLFNPVGDDESTLVDFVPDEGAEDVVEETTKSEQLAVLKSVLGVLNDRERFIIDSIYGFNTEEKSLSDLASVLHISRERVRQIQQNAFVKIRRAAGSRLGM